MLRPYIKAVACIQTADGQGSGFVIRNTDTGEGYLLTNAHVVGVTTASVTVYLENVEYTGEVLMPSLEYDLAMVRICCGDFTVLQRANRGLLEGGEWVGALGFQGGNFTAAAGHVAAVFDHSDWVTYVEHTGDVQAGGSGGPLLGFPYTAVVRAKEGQGLTLEEGETLGVLGITKAKSTEHDYTSYAVFHLDATVFVNQVWSTLDLEQARPPAGASPATPALVLDW